ncbi:hypothetical protein [uncultured Draconibacterium sp.]|mgnify:CR=1 FL=1|uniref:hypothetical protein n=1 Tax=uncultured Draconibacterium sp. TaxID=1573823 RepID=UPI0025FE583F|nr:hypothetical protein [uncultured Draconibacterium sp.]
MNRLHLIILLLFFTNVAKSQVRATTESGNKVLLFDDGTWKYEEKKLTSSVTEIAAVSPEIQPVLKIDSLKELSTEETELFYAESKRLSRYFGEEQGRIRCKVKCVNHLGELKILYHFDIRVADGERYFGYLKKGTKITLHLLEGQQLEFYTSVDVEIEGMDQYNLTKMFGVATLLSAEQVQILTVNPVLKMEIDWKKKSELYELNDSKFFIKTLPQILF